MRTGVGCARLKGITDDRVKRTGAGKMWLMRCMKFRMTRIDWDLHCQIQAIYRYISLEKDGICSKYIKCTQPLRGCI
jgi:hypothetical protein